MKILQRLGIAASASLLTLPSIAAPAPQGLAPTYSIMELGGGKFELVTAGRLFTTRDEVERELLLEAARLSLAHGAGRFVLLSMPGERTDIHPPRRNADFGIAYGHWQPHWNYYVSGEGWQPWHPEWGARFWAEEVDLKRVEQFQAHAIISLGPPAETRDETQLFDANAIIRDLTKQLSTPDHSGHHQR